MAGKIRITSTAFPSGDNETIQYNDDGYFGGAAQLFWDKTNNRLGLGTNLPLQQLSLTKCMEMSICSGSGTGVIYKGATRFIHDFKAASTDGHNIFLGLNAGNFSMAFAGASQHASYNIGIGYDVLKMLTYGHSNVGLGAYALMNMTTGKANIAIGLRTLQYNITGNNNVAIGKYAGYGVVATSIINNTLLGYRAGYALTTGGDNNILIGYQAGDNITSGEKNIIIGYDLDALAVAGDYQLSIGGVIFGDLGTTKKIGIKTSTLSEVLNVGGAIRLANSTLTNAGTIRWTDVDFEGYTGAAWKSLTTGNFSDGGEAGEANRTLGNTDNFSLGFKTNDIIRLHINNDGRIGINTTTPATSALLDLTSTTGTLLLTRMTTTQKNALTAVNGMLLYDSTLNKFQSYENGAWKNLGSSIWTDQGTYIDSNSVDILRINDDIANMSWATPYSHAIQSQIQVSMDYNAVPASNLRTAFSVQAEGKGLGTTAFRGVCGVYALAKDRSGVTSANKGVLYGLLAEVYPNVARGSTSPGDDAVCLAISNAGSAKATEGIYIGHNSGLGDDFCSVICIDAHGDYGLRFAGTYDYGIDMVAGGPATINTGAIRIPNNKSIYARNGANSANLSLIYADFNNNVMMGFNCNCNIGYGASANNPIAIRVNGVDSQTILKSIDTDSQGKHYLVI